MFEIYPELTSEEARHQRSYLRRVIGVGLVGAAAIVLTTIWATKAYAEEIPVHVYEEGGVYIRLMPGPCVDGTSSALLVQHLPKYSDRAKAIESVWPMRDGTKKSYVGCWLELSAEEADGEAALVLVFEDTQGFVFKKKEFLKKPGQGGA